MQTEKQRHGRPGNEKSMWTSKSILTAVDCHIISVVAECTDGCAILTREEVKVAGRVTVHIVQENSATALAKAVR